MALVWQLLSRLLPTSQTEKQTRSQEYPIGRAIDTLPNGDLLWIVAFVALLALGKKQKRGKHGAAKLFNL